MHAKKFYVQLFTESLTGLLKQLARYNDNIHLKNVKLFIIFYMSLLQDFSSPTEVEAIIQK